MKTWYWFMVSLAVVILDQLSKYWIILAFMPFKVVPLFPMLNLTLAYNTGAAFGFLNSSGDWHKWFFAAFGLSMCLIIGVCIWRMAKQNKLQSAGLSFILGGAIGNLLDRALHGHVIDFIDVYYKTHHFATFNLADSAICIGAGLLFLDFLCPGVFKQNKKFIC